MRRGAEILLTLAAGALLRAAVAWATPIPAEDGVNYLWMAERFAAGDARAALSEVFPPLLPLLAAPAVALGLEAFRAVQCVAILAGTLAILPLAAAAQRLAPEAWRAALWLAVTMPLPVRQAAECYTEPLYLLLAALALVSALERRWVAAGMLAGFAFWTRPEGVLLPLAFALATPRAGLRLLAPCGVAVLALAAWRAQQGLGFSVSAKFEFLQAQLGRELGSNLLALPWTCVEAFYLLAPLALLGAFRARRQIPAGLWWLLALHAGLVLAYLARRRFLVSWTPVVLPLAALGLCSLRARWRTPLLWLCVVGHAALTLRVQDADRIAERRIGEYLRGRELASDMTRVLYYAGQRPLPPRRFNAEELVGMAEARGVEFCVLGSHRATTPEVVARLGAAWMEEALPDALTAVAGARGILVLRRR